MQDNSAKRHQKTQTFTAESELVWDWCIPEEKKQQQKKTNI